MYLKYNKEGYYQEVPSQRENAKALHKEKLHQMVLQYLSNASDEGAKRDSK